MNEARFSGRVGTFKLEVGFDVPASGTTALFGASGSGKTTLLRCMAGLHRLDGRLEVNGETWQDDASSVFVPAHRREVGYVFQEASLFAHLSVRRNLNFAHGAGKSVGRFEEIVDLLGLEALLNRSPEALSGGERQRVALGRALLSRPKLLLMDEPLSALDRGAKEQILPYFEQLSSRFDLPVIYVSHDIAEVSRLADRIVVLSKGHKVAEGPLSEVLERIDLHPATGRFEAHVVLDARVERHDDTYQLTTLDCYGQALEVPRINTSAGDAVRVRIRARDVVLAAERPGRTSARNVLRGRVVAIAEEPDTAYAETLVDLGGARLRARLTRRSVADLELREGMAVFAMVKSIAFERASVSVSDRKP